MPRPDGEQSPHHVTEPLTGTGKPYGTPRVDVSPRGYFVEEFVLAGTATAYAMAGQGRPAVDGRWELDERGVADYVTRLLVIRPTDPTRFNATVLLNWQNVSAGAEMPAPSDGEMHDGGYALVGVSAQEVGIYGYPMSFGHRYGGAAIPLKDHDPERYRPLVHPGDQGSFSIFDAAARAVGPARDGSVDPLGGLAVERVVATGGSQSAMRLVAYFNGLHARDPVVDGFVLGVWEGAAPRYEDGPMPYPMRTRVRDDVLTPVIVVNSEFEATPLARISAVDTETFRIWEVTGTPHAPLPVRDGTDQWRSNPLTIGPVHEAAVRSMQRWLVDGVAPRHQPRIEVEPGGRAHIPRDDLGNARGGIRLPELAAPLREYRGIAYDTDRPPLFGSSRSLPLDVVHARYRSQADYAALWDAAIDDLVDAGVVRPQDAGAMKARVLDLSPREGVGGTADTR